MSEPIRTEVHEFVGRLGATVPGLLDPSRPVAIARAPGRLDVMGGIADYAGSLVLQWPIREATLVASQPAGDGALRIVSPPAGDGPAPREVVIGPDDLDALYGGPYDAARRWFDREPGRSWAAYVAGVLLVLAKERGLRPDHGLRLVIASRVPEGKGVGSSAALEVATMQAALPWLGARLDGVEIAKLCQMAENFIVGASCGIMDQMTSALGEADQLLALLCQPADVQGNRPVPSSIAFWGIDSGIRHAVSGSEYTSVRAGAFMGYRIIAERAGLELLPLDGSGRLQFYDPRWHGYLANLAPDEFEREFAPHLPKTVVGAEFLSRYGGTTDAVTRVDPRRSYAVRQPTAHPIFENARVRRFAELLAGRLDEPALKELGELMFGSHASYSACGLGSDGTDRLAELVRAAGPASGVYGAKITGGGRGGAVAVLGRADAGPVVAEIARHYRAETGRDTYLFSGSSPGACHFGVRIIESLRHGADMVSNA